MADWYVSSVKYAAIAVWQASHAYAGGDKVRQVSPTAGNERVFVCGVAGTSGAAEPTWVLTKGNSTTSDNGVGWTESTGSLFYGWAAASGKLSVALAWAANGDNIWMDSTHAETQAAAMTLTGGGSDVAPVFITCVSAAGSVPPVEADYLPAASSTTPGGYATVKTTGNSNIDISGSNGLFVRGVEFWAGNSTGTASVILYRGQFENCILKLAGTGASSVIAVSNGSVGAVDLNNTQLIFGAVGQGLQNAGNGNIRWRGPGSSLAGGTYPTTLFNGGNTRAGFALFDGVDLSAMGSGKTLVGIVSASGYRVQLVNCKFGASVAVFSGDMPNAKLGMVDYINCDSGSANYISGRFTYGGVQSTETTVVRTGGESDGTTAFSWKIVTANSNTPSFTNPFESMEISEWIDTTGLAITRTFELVNDGTTFTNADVWVEISYMGNASFPIASVVTNRMNTVASTPANLATSSATWTTTGLTTPVKQKIALTFTPQMKGLYRAVIKVAKANKTLYVCPKPSELP